MIVNPRRSGRTSMAGALLCSMVTSVLAQGQGPWEVMDYGPTLTASIEVPGTRTNIAQKGIAVRLGDGGMLFDTDLLRCAAGWTGGFVALKGVAFDGEHWAYPRIEGTEVFHSVEGPGWASRGSFADPREEPYGPLPRAHSRWKGHYLHGSNVVFSYSVGDMDVLEMPGREESPAGAVLSRSFQLGPSGQGQTLMVAEMGDHPFSLVGLPDMKPVTGERPASEVVVVVQPREAKVNPGRLDDGEDLWGRWEFDVTATFADLWQNGGSTGLLRVHNTPSTTEGRQGGAVKFQRGDWATWEGTASKMDFSRTDVTVAMWVRTSSDGVLMSRTRDQGNWVPGGVALFVRGGRLTFDVGWVGAVRGQQPVSDGAWHHVAACWNHQVGNVTLYVDGVEDGQGRVRPQAVVENPEVRLGFGAPNFPAVPWFEGAMDSLRVYGRALVAGEVAHLAGRPPREWSQAFVVRGEADGMRWIRTGEGHLVLTRDARAEGSRIQVLAWRGDREDVTTFIEWAGRTMEPPDLVPLTRGGPARWPQKLMTQGKTGTDDGPFAVDELTAPEGNPWRSWMRFGAMDFFEDGRRAAVTTWNGDVWIVRDVDGTLERLIWQRIATGLFQPLGLKIVDGEIYVLGRDQITRLHDLNGDGEADFYENFNNDARVSEHFHEFATDLKLGPDGDFYYVKCARHALPALHSQHGSLLRVSRDGSRTEVVARGFRAVNGLGVGPAGEFTTIDNQGHWMPANRLNWVQPGGWYGNQWAWNPDGRTSYDPPLCWMHNEVDRSGGTQLWVPAAAWEPLGGQLITVSYGMGRIFLVLRDPVDGVMQGAVTRLPLDFETGVMRGAFHPVNRQLYVCGLYGWAGNKTRAGGFYRIRATGRSLHLPVGLHTAKDGIRLTFTDSLDPEFALDAGNYDLKAWDYRWSAQYGSPDLRLNGEEGRDTWRVSSVALSSDRRSVFLEVPAIRPVMQWNLNFRLRGADGRPIESFVHGTIHRLGADRGIDGLGGAPSVRRAVEELGDLTLATGLKRTLESLAEPADRDVTQARLAALFVPEGEPVSPWVGAGPFRVRWSGWLRNDVNDIVQFHFAGRGVARLTVNGTRVHEEEGGLGRESSPPVPLRGGLNPLIVEYESPKSGDSEFRLEWSSARFVQESVPPTAFYHEALDAQLVESQRRRRGRTLLAERRCVACHDNVAIHGDEAMPELKAEAPSFSGLGDRLKSGWLARWILDPKSIRHDARMPRLLRGESAARDARDLAAFLVTLIEPPTIAKGASPPLVDAEVGRQTFLSLGCRGCHPMMEEKLQPDDTRISLLEVPRKWQAAALVDFLRAPAKHHPWTRMPDFHLSLTEAASLGAYLLEIGVAADDVTSDTGAPDADRGRQLAETLGCFHCHPGVEGAGRRSIGIGLADLDFGKTELGCLAAGEAGRGSAPDFGWSDEEREALQALGDTDVVEVLGRDTASDFAERHYEVLRCQACHGRDGTADLLSGLPAFPTGLGSDVVVDEDEEGAGSVGSVHAGRPPLTHAGEKLYTDWMERLLNGTLPYRARPALQGRMPAFAAYAGGLAEGLAHQHGYGTGAAPVVATDATRVELGARLTTVEGGFSCVSCHGVGEQKALAGPDTATVNFAAVGDRLRSSYFWRYVHDPTRLVPGTMMPKFIGDDGKTAIRGVFDGDPTRQFDAIWQYLQSLRGSWRPEIGRED